MPDLVRPRLVWLPHRERGPIRTMTRRVGYAVLVVVLMVTAVVVDREGYRDNADGVVSVLDAVYYATVSLSTTGYGDIVPVTDGARLTNVVLIMPLRVFFLALLVGTTFEVHAARTRERWRLSRWRSRVRNHTIVVGYGTKGRSAISTLMDNGIPADDMVVIDSRHSAANEATEVGLTTIVGDATRSMVLHQAELARAARVVVAVDRDDTAVLITLTVRQINPDVPVAAAVREAENALLLRQSGATTVITTSDAAGRLLGLSAYSPATSAVIGDLLVQGQGLDLVDRPARPEEVGCLPGHCPQMVLAVVRGDEVVRYDRIDRIAQGDRLIVVHARG